MQTLSHELQADGMVKVTIVGQLGPATLAENSRYPWTPWNVAYQQKQLEKDGSRVLQSLSNLMHVESTLAARTARREEAKAAKALAATASASQPAQQPVVEAPAPQPAPAATEAPRASERRAAKQPKRARRS